MSTDPTYITETAPERPIPTYVDGTPAYRRIEGEAPSAAATQADEECTECSLSAIEAVTGKRPSKKAEMGKAEKLKLENPEAPAED